MDLNNYLWSFAFSPKEFLYIFCKVGLLTTKSLGSFLVYFPIENTFILPSFLRDIFAGYKILGWLLFFLSGLWICPSTTLSLVSTVSSDRSLLTSLRFSVQSSHSSSAALWDFFFVFTTFFFFTMMCLGVDFFMFMLLGVHYVSWMWRLFFHQIWEVFNKISSHIFFCSSLSSRETCITCTFLSFMVSHISWGSVHFLHFFLSFELHNLYHSIFKFTYSIFF